MVLEARIIVRTLKELSRSDSDAYDISTSSAHTFVSMTKAR